MRRAGPPPSWELATKAGSPGFLSRLFAAGGHQFRGRFHGAAGHSGLPAGRRPGPEGARSRAAAYRWRLLTNKGSLSRSLISIAAPQALPLPEAGDSRTGRCRRPQEPEGATPSPPTTTAVDRRVGSVPPCKGDGHVTGRRAWRRCAWLNAVRPRREGTVGKIRSPRRGDGIGPTAQRW
jgi:hypothetical protein